GSISLEDALLAGALTRHVAQVQLTIPTLPDDVLLGNDEALLAAFQWLGAAQGLRERPMNQLLSMGRGGQNVQRIGMSDAIAAAAQVNRFDLIAELCRDPLRIVVV